MLVNAGNASSSATPLASRPRSASTETVGAADIHGNVSWPCSSNTGRQPPPSELTVTLASRRAGIEITQQRHVRRPGIFIVSDRKCRDIDGARTFVGQLDRFLEQRFAPVDMRGVKHARRNFAFVQGLRRTASEPPLTVAHVQMQDAGLAGNQACDVRIAGNSQQFISGWADWNGGHSVPVHPRQ